MCISRKGTSNLVTQMMALEDGNVHLTPSVLIIAKVDEDRKHKISSSFSRQHSKFKQNPQIKVLYIYQIFTFAANDLVANV